MLKSLQSQDRTPPQPRASVVPRLRHSAVDPSHLLGCPPSWPGINDDDDGSGGDDGGDGDDGGGGGGDGDGDDGGGGDGDDGVVVAMVSSRTYNAHVVCIY